MSDSAALVPASDSTLHGWGMLGVPGTERRSEDLPGITEGAVLTRGLGRSYGDSSLPPPDASSVASSVLADRILAFDASTGVMRVEAGFSLAELMRLFLPRGWFTPVSPGTKFITVGGAVASDVHGKNHHRMGCFGEHVSRLRMRVADGRVLECSMEEHPDLFLATIGGMGLTGHILEVEFRLARVPSPWIFHEAERVPDVETFVRKLKEDGPRWPLTMGWVDCVSRGRGLGRGVLQRGRWAEAAEAPPVPPAVPTRLTVPFRFPNWVLSWYSARIFNSLYYWKQMPRNTWGIWHPDRFFYPLDGIHHWNRVYGRRGFTQYQCVLPDPDTPGKARRFLEILTERGGASPLCVIKDCGAEGRGMLSFPMKGISIAVDLWVDDRTRGLVDTLNEFVIEQGGRIYLTKDTFTREEHFRAMEPRLPAWQAVRRRWDPERRIRSAQSVRMLGDSR